jgi:nicotinamidase/pyrazinamidase
MSSDSVRVLVVTNVQTDFFGDGPMAVPDGGRVVGIINSLRHRFHFDHVFICQSWFPVNHRCFSSNQPGSEAFSVHHLPEVGSQVVYPDHCVQGTQGANVHPGLHVETSDTIIRMGTDPRCAWYAEERRAHCVSPVCLCALWWACCGACGAACGVCSVGVLFERVRPEPMA